MKILLIEDDEKLSDAVAEQLRAEQYEVEICYSGEDADYYLRQNTHDVIILDRMLPVVDGLTLMQQLRKRGNHTPVIMVTAMNGLNDRIDGLDSGADDYLVKPFEMEELLARVRALLRRPKQMEESELLSFEDIQFNVRDKTLKLVQSQENIRLSKREGALLEYFIVNAKQVVTREQILSRVWGNNTFVEDGNIDNYIHILRKRLKMVGSKVVIKTVYGIGYQIQSL